MIVREHFTYLAPHARHVRRALEVGAVSRRPDVVLRLQLPPAALRQRLERVYVVRCSGQRGSDVASTRSRRHEQHLTGSGSAAHACAFAQSASSNPL